jgi:hypothetical protein
MINSLVELHNHPLLSMFIYEIMVFLFIPFTNQCGVALTFKIVAVSINVSDNGGNNVVVQQSLEITLHPLEEP